MFTLQGGGGVGRCYHTVHSLPRNEFLFLFIFSGVGAIWIAACFEMEKLKEWAVETTRA